MVNPITNVVINKSYKVVNRAVHSVQHVYRQKPPHDLDLPYIRIWAESKHSDGIYDFNQVSGRYSSFLTSITVPPSGSTGLYPYYAAAYNNAFNRLVGRVHGGKGASLGITAVEARESARMIHARAQQLVGFTHALVRKDLGGILRNLQLNRAEDRGRAYRTLHRGNPVKNFASSFLEFSWGWRPLIEDVGNAVEVLQAGFKEGAVSASSTVSFNHGGGSNYCIGFCRILLGANIRTSNPNIRLANELGFINPVQVAWNVIPLSFLIDQFVGISKFLGSYSAFWGVEITSGYMTDHRVITRSSTVWNVGNTPKIVAGYAVSRSLQKSFPIPDLQFRLPATNLIARAASSTALLVQTLLTRK